MPLYRPQGLQQPTDNPLLQKILGGVLGPQQTYGGLLTPEDQRAAQQQGLLALGSQLLSAGGPSPTPVSFGQALGGALQAGQQTQRQSGLDALQAMLLRTKLQKAGQVSQPSDVRSYEYAKANGFQGTFEDWKRVAAAQPQDPSAIREYEFFQKLPPEQQKQFIDLKRNTQPFQLVDVGGGKQLLNRSTGGLQGVTTAEDEASGAGQIAASTAGGKATGEAQATAQVDLPRVEDNARQMLSLLDRIKSHPGRKAATGGSSVLPLHRIPGTDARDFAALLEQLRGKQFLEAYSTLKGGGQITEVEGKKAETAISTIQDIGQSEPAYLQAIQDLTDVVNVGVERARKKAGGSQTPPKRVRVDAQGNPL